MMQQLSLSRHMRMQLAVQSRVSVRALPQPKSRRVSCAAGQEEPAATPKKVPRPLKESKSLVSAEDSVRLRSEAEAPFRSLRLTLFGFSVVSAGVGLLTSIPQLIGALGKAPNALPLDDVLTNLGINAAAAGIFAFLFSRDWKARDKQMARLTREEALAACKVELANKKVLSLGTLRGAARVVVCAGTNAQVRDALAAAELLRGELERRGVFVVAAPIFEDEASPSGSPPPEPPAPEDLRWRANATNTQAWREWFAAQLSLSSKATSERGLYVSLRKDGRVRGSGMGSPPWAVLAAQLPPEEGMWTGLLDGMDGRISMWQ